MDICSLDGVHSKRDNRYYIIEREFSLCQHESTSSMLPNKQERERKRERREVGAENEVSSKGVW
jgi:hypothetical protein